jgi:signal transduction histidine kinase
MQKLLDILASGIHDAKNQLFIAESLISDAEKRHSIDLAEARYALESAANRMSRMLTSYRVMRHESRLSLLPVIVSDLCAEIALDQRNHLAHRNLALDVECTTDEAWPLDRDLVIDMLNNAVQNAGRHARQRIRLTAEQQGEMLVFTVDDDGPGFANLPPSRGTGLLLAAELARMHVRRGHCGSLTLSNSSPLGGARFELRLP